MGLSTLAVCTQTSVGKTYLKRNCTGRDNTKISDF